MDGLLIIDKPAGPTSHEVVARVRRATGWKKVGHTGTLDPMATGVLPLVVGRATRLAQFLSASDKVYEAEVRLGWATDTYDAWGRAIDVSGVRSPESGVEGWGTGVQTPERPRSGGVASERDPVSWPPLDETDRLLDRFRGTYVQTAPPFSAKKIDGIRAYMLARQGKPIQPKACEVTVHEMRCIGQEGDRLRVRISCSAGFYVRSFAHDLGDAVGVGAHLSALRRTKSGEADVSAAVSLDAVERAGRAAATLLTPLEAMLSSLPVVVVNQQGAERTRHGNDLRPEDLDSTRPAAFAGRVRIVDERGTLLAIGEPSTRPGLLHPGIVVV